MAPKDRPPDGNWVALAIERLGGLTKTVVATGASATTIDRWRRIGYVADPQVLIKLSNLTGIAPHYLAGLDAKGNPLGGSSSGLVDAPPEPPDELLPTG